MSLRLRQAIPGRPTVKSRYNTCAGQLEGDPFIAYTSGPDVVILDGDHDLLETLPFWSALPYRSASSSRYEVEGVIWDRVTSSLIAWSGVNIVLWKRKVQHDAASWVLHSTLVSTAPVTALDYAGPTGVVAVGHRSGLEMWKHDPKAAVVVWDRLWDWAMPAPDMIAIAPGSSHVGFFAKGERCVRILSIDAKGQLVGIPQEMRHPREIAHISWRKPRTSSGDPYLYTITTNSVLRIYAPVLDDPAWFQLHSTLDSQSFSPPAMASTNAKAAGKKRHPLLQTQSHAKGSIWPLDADAVRAAVLDDLVEDAEGRRRLPTGVRKVLEGIEGEEADLILWVGQDGSVAVRSILNMDRKPPTLLKSSLLGHTQLPGPLANTPDLATYPSLLQTSTAGHLQAVLPVPASSPNPPTLSIQSYFISLPLLLAHTTPNAPVATACIRPAVSRTPDEPIAVQLSSPISHFTRTPNGRGLLSTSSTGEIGVWGKEQRGKPVRGRKGPKSLLGRGQWKESVPPSECTLYAKGRAIVFYVKPTQEGGKGYVSLQHLDPDQTTPSQPVMLPDFELQAGDDIAMLSAASDIDDGSSSRDRRTRQAVIAAVSQRGEAWVWEVDSDTKGDPAQLDEVNGTASTRDKPAVKLFSHSTIPCCRDEPSDPPVQNGDVNGNKSRPDRGVLPAHVLPVDPMGWHQSVIDWQNQAMLQDIVLTVSPSGVLEFWRPRIGEHAVNNRFSAHVGHDNARGEGYDTHTDPHWARTGIVRTDRTDIRAARCSSRKKTVLVRDVDAPNGKGKVQEMTIWDSNVGEFSTGLEMCKIYPGDDIIQDLDWTTTSDLQSILAVGFPHRIELVCEQRMSYSEGTPGWATFVTIDMTRELGPRLKTDRYCPSPIADSIWLAGGSLAVGCGNQIYLFSRYLDRESPIPTPRSSVKDVRIDDAEPEDVFQLVASQNGPVVDYHPTILAQCVLLDKVDLVKTILISLSAALRTAIQEEKRRIAWKRLDPSDFIAATPRSAPKAASKESRYDALFNLTQPETEVEDDDPFSARLVDELADNLSNDRIRLPLTQHERSLLATLARAVLEAAVQKRALDAGGLRYLFSLRMFVHETQLQIAKDGGKANGVSHSPSSITLVSAASAQSKGGPASRAPRLSFRNIVWASHSESQEVMLAAATETCPDGKMGWEGAKRLGVFLWLRSADTVKSQLEAVARNRFMADELRDPTSCSLIFFALGKKKVVHGLWRQAPEHKEQNLMLKFLANDFEQDRWKLAAKKNAYALLSRQRYEYAAAFFMLAGVPRDAINVVLRQMGDWQLAYALARAVEGTMESTAVGPLVRFILEDTVIPMAFEGGHRWLATWAFWTLGRRDLAVRVLISPMTEVASAYSPTAPIEVGFPENDDPSLLLLFSALKSRSLQTAKGTAAISGKIEFDFVLHNARVFCRMGCHPLALSLLRGWSFDRPELPDRYLPKTKHKFRGSKGVGNRAGKSVVDTPISEDGSSRVQYPPAGTPGVNGHMRRTPSFGSAGASASPTSPKSPTRMMTGSYSRMRRPSFMLSAQNGRRESMVADMQPEESDSDSDSEEVSSGASGNGPKGDRLKSPFGENATSRSGGGFPWDLIPEEPLPQASTNGKGDEPSRQAIATPGDVSPGQAIPEKPYGIETKKAVKDLKKEKEEEKGKEEEEGSAPTKGMGNLMKLEQRGDVNQGATEFSFDSFGF